MFLIDTLILVTGVLLLLGIASSKVSARLGMPVLVLFLGLGMLAGSEGIGGIEFDNNVLAHGIGSLALAMILFDGGLETPVSAVRMVWRPALVLATIGVLITALVTGWAASVILEIPLLDGLLLGSIVGSTDAAAVFAVLRYGGVTLSKRLASTLEVESASNDPMAIFLTVGCIEVLMGRMTPGVAMLGLFAEQMLIGGVVGVALGLAAVRVVNRIHLDTAGLYPVLVSGFCLLTFGVTVILGGSGFLAVYLAGIVIGNSRLVFQQGILLFHNATAWLSQIVMFVVLGLLCSPSRLLEVAPRGLLVGLVLIVLARPLALVTILPFRFPWRDWVFLSWVGLKGAVPITLATFPLMYGVPRAQLLFDVVFFVVVLSAVVQGASLPPVARWLGLDLPPEPAPPVRLEIISLKHVDGEVVDYAVVPDSRAAGRRVRDLALPEGVVIAMIVREQQIIPPHGNTQIQSGDHVILVLRSENLPLVTEVFSGKSGGDHDLPRLLEFPLRPTVTVGELEAVYGIRMNAPQECTLDQAIRERLGEDEELYPGYMVRFGPIALHVRGLSSSGRIETVGMVVLPTEDVEDSEGVTVGEPLQPSTTTSGENA